MDLTYIIFLKQTLELIRFSSTSNLRTNGYRQRAVCISPSPPWYNFPTSETFILAGESSCLFSF
jgi:hypothetical protein